MKSMKIFILFVAVLVLTSCSRRVNQLSAYSDLSPQESFLIIENQTSGTFASDMKIFINGNYVMNLPPGGRTEGIIMPAGQTFTIEGQSSDGSMLWPKKVVTKSAEGMIVALGK